MDLLLIILATILGLIPAFIAKSKNRNFFIWWIYGFLCWVIAMPIILFVKPIQECPFCKKDVIRGSTICRFCHSKITKIDPDVRYYPG